MISRLMELALTCALLMTISFVVLSLVAYFGKKYVEGEDDYE